VIVSVEANCKKRRPHLDRVCYPTEVRHIAAAGGDNVFTTEFAALRRLGKTSKRLTAPPAPLLPADATFVDGGKVRAVGVVSLLLRTVAVSARGPDAVLESAGYWVAHYNNLLWSETLRALL